MTRAAQVEETAGTKTQNGNELGKYENHKEGQCLWSTEHKDRRQEAKFSLSCNEKLVKDFRQESQQDL